jgi:hypothetical protein
VDRLERSVALNELREKTRILAAYNDGAFNGPERELRRALTPPGHYQSALATTQAAFSLAAFKFAEG